MPRKTITPQWLRGVWQVRLLTPATGTRDWYKLRGIERDDFGLAVAAATELRAQLQSKKHVPEERGETVREYAARWIAWRKGRGIAMAIEDEIRFRLHIDPQLGLLPIAGVTKAHLEDFVTHLDERARGGDFGESYAGAIWGTMATIMRDATGAKDRKLRAVEGAVNPALGVAPPDRGTRRAKVYLYPGEFLKLVACDDVPLERAELYAVATYSYLRASELTSLEWPDVLLEHHQILVHRAEDRNRDRSNVAPKGDKTRRITFEDELAPLLQRMRERGRRGLVFPKPPAASGDYGLASLLRRDLLAAGVTRDELHNGSKTRKRMTFHDLRATGATWLAQRGDPPQRVQARLGHADFRTTLGYVREAEQAVFTESVFPSLPARLVGPQVGLVGPQNAELPLNLVGAVGLEATCENSVTTENLEQNRRVGAVPVDVRDPVAESLARAIDRATAAGDFAAALELARIADRRLGREADPVDERALELLRERPR